jgi:glutaconyl-CoA decarboxylase
MISKKYPLHPYFTKMDDIGSELTRVQKKNIEELKEIEAGIAKEVERVKNAGKSVEVMNAKGEWTAWQRLEYLVDPGTWCPLHTIYDPAQNEEGTTNVIDGLGKIAGR